MTREEIEKNKDVAIALFSNGSKGWIGSLYVGDASKSQRKLKSDHYAKTYERAEQMAIEAAEKYLKTLE